MHNLIYQVDDSLPRMAWSRGSIAVLAKCISIAGAGSSVDLTPSSRAPGPAPSIARDSIPPSLRARPEESFCRTAFCSHADSTTRPSTPSAVAILSGFRTRDLPSPGFADFAQSSNPYYECDLMSVMFGLDDYREYIPTEKKGPIRVHYHRNLVALDGVRLETRPRPLPDPFDSYRQYSTFLDSKVSALMRNAADPSRRVTFAPLSTISTGYGSPACAVLVRRAGCSEAFTFARARAGFEDRDDSGRRIGEALGLRVTEVDVEAPWRRAIPTPSSNSSPPVSAGTSAPDRCRDVLAGGCSSPVRTATRSGT